MTDDKCSPMDITSGTEELDFGLAGEQSRPQQPPPKSKTPAIEDDETKVETDDKEIMKADSDDDANDLKEAKVLNTSPELPMSRTVTKPFVYGSVSRELPRALPNGHTHLLTIYLRPRYNEDMSLYVSRVEFRINSISLIRVCTKLPYEMVKLTGCGEFAVQIKLFFVDKSLRPVTLAHTLTLFKAEDPSQVMASRTRNPLMSIPGNVPAEFEDRPSKMPPPGMPLVAEHYDEFVFANPSDTLYSNLIHAWKCTRPDWQPPRMDWDEIQFRQLKALRSARTLVQQEIEKGKNNLKDMTEYLKILKKEVKRIGSEMNLDNDEEVDMLLDVPDYGPGTRSIAPVDTNSDVTMDMGSSGDGDK